MIEINQWDDDQNLVGSSYTREALEHLFHTRSRGWNTSVQTTAAQETGS